jgi:hypothetical protein
MLHFIPHFGLSGRLLPVLLTIKIPYLLKLSLYMPGQTQGLQEFEVSRISTKSAGEGGKVVRLIYRPPLHPRRDPWYTFLLEAESTPGPYCGLAACGAGSQ